MSLSRPLAYSHHDAKRTKHIVADYLVPYCLKEMQNQQVKDQILFTIKELITDLHENKVIFEGLTCAHLKALHLPIDYDTHREQKIFPRNKAYNNTAQTKALQILLHACLFTKVGKSLFKSPRYDNIMYHANLEYIKTTAEQFYHNYLAYEMSKVVNITLC